MYELPPNRFFTRRPYVAELTHERQVPPTSESAASRGARQLARSTPPAAHLRHSGERPAPYSIRGRNPDWVALVAPSVVRPHRTPPRRSHGFRPACPRPGAGRLGVRLRLGGTLERLARQSLKPHVARRRRGAWPSGGVRRAVTVGWARSGQRSSARRPPRHSSRCPARRSVARLARRRESCHLRAMRLRSRSAVPRGRRLCDRPRAVAPHRTGFGRRIG